MRTACAGLLVAGAAGAAPPLLGLMTSSEWSSGSATERPTFTPLAAAALSNVPACRLCAFARRPNLARHGVAAFQRKLLDLLGRNVHVVGRGQVEQEVAGEQVR